MLSTEGVQTIKGVKVFEKGKSYTEEDWIAASLVGRGFATLDNPPALADDSVKFDGLNVANLREMAKLAHVPNYKKMSRDELIAALELNKLKGSTHPAEPVERLDITKGIAPPEFTLKELTNG